MPNANEQLNPSAERYGKNHVRVFAELSIVSLRVLVILGPRAEPKLELLKRASCWLFRYYSSNVVPFRPPLLGPKSIQSLDLTLENKIIRSVLCIED